MTTLDNVLAGLSDDSSETEATETEATETEATETEATETEATVTAGKVVKCSKRNSIQVVVTWIGTEPTVTPEALAAALAEFKAKPKNTTGLAEAEEFLNARFPVGEHKNRKEIDFLMQSWCTGNFAKYENLNMVVAEMLKDSARFEGQKGRPSKKEGVKGGGYTRLS